MKRGLEPRRRPFRDARLFVIAVEGEKTEPQYFEGLQSHGIVGGRRIRVHLLPTSDGKSSPGSVANRLAEFTESHSIQSIDQLWLVIDVDRWPEKALTSVGLQAKQKGFEVALSDPCFEIWLQLHFTDTPSGKNSQKAKSAWRQLRPPSEKWPFNNQNVRDAAQRGKTADTGGRRPTRPGSHVHRLVGEMLRFSST